MATGLTKKFSWSIKPFSISEPTKVAPAVHDDVLARLAFELVHGLDQVAPSTRTFRPSIRLSVLLKTTLG